MENLLRQALKATGGLDETVVPHLVQRMRSHYSSNMTNTTKPYPGAIEAIEALRAKGVKIGMVTNKAMGPANKLLTELGIRDLFDDLIGGDTLSAQKPDGAPIVQMIRRCGGGHAAYVGDSYYDVKAARNADIFSVVVSFGYHPGAVEDLGATAVIDDFADLLPTLERLGASIA
jgi:phosphoglycolate phosphatase